jgi:monoamine oxidase
VKRFADKAGSPVNFVEQDWSAEQYSEFGHALREPSRRIHWAGTESSAVMCGWVDGAVRSGERAASEVLAAESVSMA